jgi:hypothetical protein
VGPAITGLAARRAVIRENVFIIKYVFDDTGCLSKREKF